jgi:hypothetical protein
MIPGTLPGAANPNNSTNQPGANFPMDRIMRWDPVAKTWEDIGDEGSNASDVTWMSVHDFARNVFLRFRKNELLQVYNIAGDTWDADVDLGLNGVGGKAYVGAGYTAVDRKRRVVYLYSAATGHLHSVGMDSRAMTDLGDMPGPTTASVNITQAENLVWDERNEVLIRASTHETGFWAYHPARAGSAASWEELPQDSNVEDVKAFGQTLAYDPFRNVFVLFGWGQSARLDGDLGRPAGRRRWRRHADDARPARRRQVATTLQRRDAERRHGIDP